MYERTDCVVHGPLVYHDDYELPFEVQERNDFRYVYASEMWAAEEKQKEVEAEVVAKGAKFAEVDKEVEADVEWKHAEYDDWDGQAGWEVWIARQEQRWRWVEKMMTAICLLCCLQFVMLMILTMVVMSGVGGEAVWLNGLQSIRDRVWSLLQ